MHNIEKEQLYLFQSEILFHVLFDSEITKPNSVSDVWNVELIIFA